MAAGSITSTVGEDISKQIRLLCAVKPNLEWVKSRGFVYILEEVT